MEKDADEYWKPFLDICEQRDFLTFKDVLKFDTKSEEIVGQGTNSVVLNIAGEEEDRSPVAKVIPIGHECMSDEEFTKNTFSELAITKAISHLNKSERISATAFCHLKKSYIVRDRLPKNVLEICVKNLDLQPKFRDLKLLLRKSNMFVVCVFEHSGEPLCQYELSLQQAKSCILQVACSLAVAEETLQFEHRDLHSNNILLTTGEDAVEKIRFRIGGRTILINPVGTRFTIIDLGFARATIDDVDHFNNLSGGFSSTESNKIYISMSEILQDDWKTFKPENNVLWIGYLINYFINEECERGKDFNEMLLHFDEFLNICNYCNSAAEFVKMFLDNSLIMAGEI